MSEITLFLSGVPDECHHEDSDRSWRKALEQALNGLKRDEILVVTQKTTLESTVGDSLEILEKAIKRSDYLIHLCGDFPGGPASERSLSLLRERSSDFLSNKPELRQLLPDWNEISSTQWELYFAWQHYPVQPLIFSVDEEVSRERTLTPEEKASQERHREVIKASGQECPVVYDQDHLARLVQTFLVKEGMLEQGGYQVSKNEVIAKAKEELGDLVRKIGKKLNIGVPDRVLQTSKGDGKARLEALESGAKSAGISARELMELLDAYLAKQGREVEEFQSFDSYYELAYASLIVGEYREAIEFARAAADLAMQGRVNSKTKQGRISRDNARDALVLLHDVAVLDHHPEVGVEALRQGSLFWSKENKTLGWADYHFQLAEYLYEIGKFGDVDRLLWGIEGDSGTDDEEGVFDIYEEYYGKANPEGETEQKLARAVLLLSRGKNHLGSFKIAKDLAGRARRIYGHYGPLALQSVASCLLEEGLACGSLGDLEEAVVLMQAALDIIVKQVSQEPGNVFFQRKMGIESELVSGVSEEQGELEATLAEFVSSLETGEDLVSEEPGDLASLRDYGIALSRCAQLRLSRGERNHAEELLRAAMECFQTVLGGGVGKSDVASKVEMAKELLAAERVVNAV